MHVKIREKLEEACSLPSTMWVPGFELEVSSLVAGSLTCWTISGSLVGLLSLILEQLVEKIKKKHIARGA